MKEWKIKFLCNVLSIVTRLKGPAIVWIFVRYAGYQRMRDVWSFSDWPQQNRDRWVSSSIHGLLHCSDFVLFHNKTCLLSGEPRQWHIIVAQCIGEAERVMKDVFPQSRAEAAQSTSPRGSWILFLSFLLCPSLMQLSMLFSETELALPDPIV